MCFRIKFCIHSRILDYYENQYHCRFFVQPLVCHKFLKLFKQALYAIYGHVANVSRFNFFQIIL
jgi:hypothetical protein